MKSPHTATEEVMKKFAYLHSSACPTFPSGCSNQCKYYKIKKALQKQKEATAREIEKIIDKKWRKKIDDIRHTVHSSCCCNDVIDKLLE